VSATAIKGQSITATALAANSITATAIAANTITASALAANSITATALAAGSITATAIAAGSITATALAANSITATAIGAQQVGAAAISAGSITATALAANSITATALGAQSITATALAAQSITATAIATQTITADKLQANSITATAIAAQSIGATALAAQSITATALAAGSITATALSADSVTASAIKAGEVKAQHLAAQSITATALGANSITATALAAGSIQASAIAAKAITADKLLITSTDNLMPEGDFSANLVQWGGITGAWSVDPVGSRAGSTAAKAVNGATQQAIYNTKWIPVDAGSGYRVSVWTKASVTVPTAGIGLLCRTTTAAGVVTVTTIGSNSASASAANTWYQLSALYVIPAGAVKAEFGFFTESTLSTGTTWFDNFNVTRAADSQLVVDGSIDGKIITGATIRTSSASVSAIRMDSTGIYAYGASPTVPTFSISAATGVATMTGANIYGRFYSGLSGGAGFGIIPASESYNGKQVAILSSPNGNYVGSNPGGMWIDDATVTTAQPLNLRGHYGGDVEIKSQNLQMNVSSGRVGNFSNWAIGDATNGNNYLPNLLIAGPSTGYLRLANAPTTSSSANLIIATTPEGVFYRVSSSIRYKADVQDWDTADRALQLRPRSWVDRKPLDNADPFKRYYGYIAEEVEEHFPEFVVYNDFEEPESVTYDRMPSPATVATLKVFKQRIDELEARLAAAGL
jgi:hypothetical protein